MVSWLTGAGPGGAHRRRRRARRRRLRIRIRPRHRLLHHDGAQHRLPRRLALPVELLPEDLAARRLGGGGLVAEVLEGALQIGLVRLFGCEELLSHRLQGVVEAAGTLRPRTPISPRP